MSLIAKSTGTFTHDPAPMGSHLAICVKVMDLGTQKSEYLGKEIINRKVMLTWELPDEKKEFKEGEGEKPYIVSKEYTLSLHEKANLKKDLEGWRGKEFTEDELQGFDISNLLGKPCMLNIIHNKKGYAEISSVSVLPKAIKDTVPTPTNELFELSLEPNDFNQTAFDSLPDWIKNKITLSPEYRVATHPENTQMAEDNGDEDSDVPF